VHTALGRAERNQAAKGEHRGDGQSSGDQWGGRPWHASGDSAQQGPVNGD